MHFVHFRVLLAIAIYLTYFRQVDLEKLMRRKAKQWQKAAKQKELQDIDSDSGSESGDEVRRPSRACLNGFGMQRKRDRSESGRPR